MRLIALVAAGLMAAAPATAAQQPPTPAVAPAPDYAQDSAWLCLPGRGDACAVNQDATVIAADGTRTIEHFAADSDPKFDCFYVYPTVSLDQTPNSDLNPGFEERGVAAIQAARFTKHCRVFAPLYRQITLAGLRDVLAGKTGGADRVIPVEDVKAAWHRYLEHDNNGRGVVLIGHSQGSYVLKQLLQDEIDGRPEQKLLISAMLLGANVGVPEGKAVGDEFKSIPLCAASAQTGCIVTYVSFRETAPPPANSRFGLVPEAGAQAGCVNPVSPGATDVRVADAYLPSKSGFGAAPMGPWTSDGAPVTTAFVKVPGLLSVGCVHAGQFTYLAARINADPAGKRTNTLVGDVVLFGKVQADWGLHLVDMPLAMGNLVELANVQARSWRAKH